MDCLCQFALNQTLSCNIKKGCKFSSHFKLKSCKMKLCNRRPACNRILILAGDEIFIKSKTSRLNAGAPSSLLFGRYWGSFPGIKWLGRDVNHSPLSGTEVMNECSYPYILPICLNGVDRHNFFIHPCSRKKSYTVNVAPLGPKGCWIL